MAASEKPRQKVGAVDAFPPAGPAVSVNADGEAITIEEELIAKGAGTMPLQATPQAVVFAPTDEFVRLPSGVLVQYRVGDRLDPAHVGLPTLPGAVDAYGVLQPH
jgi:hypothetical protein